MHIDSLDRPIGYAWLIKEFGLASSQPVKANGSYAASLPFSC